MRTGRGGPAADVLDYGVVHGVASARAHLRGCGSLEIAQLRSECVRAPVALWTARLLAYAALFGLAVWIKLPQFLSVELGASWMVTVPAVSAVAFVCACAASALLVRAVRARWCGLCGWCGWCGAGRVGASRFGCKCAALRMGFGHAPAAASSTGRWIGAVRPISARALAFLVHSSDAFGHVSFNISAPRGERPSLARVTPSQSGGEERGGGGGGGGGGGAKFLFASEMSFLLMAFMWSTSAGVVTGMNAFENARFAGDRFMAALGGVLAFVFSLSALAFLPAMYSEWVRAMFRCAAAALELRRAQLELPSARV